MSRQLLWAVLALSVLFNLFFATGYLMARRQAEIGASPAAVARDVAKVLDLDADQAALFHRLRSEIREVESTYRDDIALAQHELEAELDHPEPDAQRVRELTERKAELMRQRRVVRSRRFGDFMKVLTRPQRARLLQRMHRDRNRRGHGHEMMRLRRFDANGDGRLDEQERARARAQIRARRESMMKRAGDGATGGGGGD